MIYPGNFILRSKAVSKRKAGIPPTLKQSIYKLIEITEKLGASRVRRIRNPNQKILHLDYICLGYAYLK